MRIATFGLMAGMLAGCFGAHAQGTTEEAVNPLSTTGNGLRLNMVSAFVSYRVDAYAGALSPSRDAYTDEVEPGGSISLAFTHFRPKTTFAVGYAGAYFGRARQTGSRSLNHGVNINYLHRFTPRWQLESRTTGMVANFDQAQFTYLASTPGDSSGTSTGDQPVSNPAVLRQLYGSRWAEFQSQLELRRIVTSRFYFYLRAIASRMQGLRYTGDLPSSPMLNSSTGGEVRSGIEYMLNQRTQIGGSIGTLRVMSRLTDFYDHSGSLALSRNLSRRWVVSVDGGLSLIEAVRSYPDLATGLHYNFGGGVAYRYRTHLFSSNLLRTTSNYYAYTATSTWRATADWNWRPGRAWSVRSSFVGERIGGTSVPVVQGWRGIAAIERYLGSSLSIDGEYCYISLPTPPTFAPHLNHQHIAQLAFVWRPGERRHVR